MLNPESMRADFQERLDAAISRRLQKIRADLGERERYIIAGARDFLERLSRTGLTLIILSSTIQPRLEEEAEALDLARYFGGRIYGGTGDPRQFTKEAVLRRLLVEHGIPGSQLLSFGDGPAEIIATVKLGGEAIAVCSDEEVNGSHVIDARKREQLLAAGFRSAIADYCGVEESLTQYFE